LCVLFVGVSCLKIQKASRRLYEAHWQPRDTFGQ
jgi:hypothetical protein